MILPAIQEFLQIVETHVVNNLIMHVFSVIFRNVTTNAKKTDQTTGK